MLVPSASSAQGFISPFIGYNFGGDAQCAEVTQCEEKATNIGIAFGSLGRVIGFEQEIGYARNFFGEAPGFESNVLTIMSNLMIAPTIGFVRPYGVGGIGLIKSKVELSTSGIGTLIDSSNNSLGWDLGGGVMLGGAHVAFRGDLRYFHSFKELQIAGFDLGGSGTKLDFGRASAAVIFIF